MAGEYFPPKQKSLIYNALLGLVLLGLILFLLISGALNQQRLPAIGMIVLGLLLLIPLLLVLYRIFTILTTVYTLGRDAIEISWGLRRELLPIGEVDWVHPVSDFETPLPLGPALLRGSYYTEKEVRGLGKTLFIATAPEQMVLIKHASRYLVISPENAAEFTQHFEQLAQLGSLQTVGAESENLRMLWQRVWADPWAKRILLAGGISFLLVFAISLVVSLTRTQIVWVSMEYVPASRAMLMSVIALFFGLINTFMGLLLYLQDRVAVFIRNLLWVSTVLVNIIFILVLIFMSV